MVRTPAHGAGGLARRCVFAPLRLSASTARASMARVGRGVSLRVRPTAGCVKPTAPPWRWRPAASLRVRPVSVKSEHLLNANPRHSVQRLVALHRRRKARPMTSCNVPGADDGTASGTIKLPCERGSQSASRISEIPTSFHLSTGNECRTPRSTRRRLLSPRNLLTL